LMQPLLCYLLDLLPRPLMLALPQIYWTFYHESIVFLTQGSLLVWHYIFYFFDASFTASLTHKSCDFIAHLTQDFLCQVYCKVYC
jgi:hypothetical protein